MQNTARGAVAVNGASIQRKAPAALPQLQKRGLGYGGSQSGSGFGGYMRQSRWKNFGDPAHVGNLRLEVIQFYKEVMDTVGLFREYWGIFMPLPIMRSRVRTAFEINKNVTEPLAILTLLQRGYDYYEHALSHIWPDQHYHWELLFKNASPYPPHFTFQLPYMFSGIDSYQNRELMKQQKLMREERLKIALGDREYPMLPGVITDETGKKLGYRHPKGPLPPGESEIFARPPLKEDWGDFPMPDPWNPHNRPQGPPNPFLGDQRIKRVEVHNARLGPYNRHRLRRFCQHTERINAYSEKEYMEYFKENTVHLMANKFELPEYDWADDRFQRLYTAVEYQNDEIFEPARLNFLEKYKYDAKTVNYSACVDYWGMVFDQWVPNYNLYIIENAENMASIWNEWISSPRNYACWRSDAFAAIRTDSTRNPLAKTMAQFLLDAQPEQPRTATRPYDHPDFFDKWHTDNGLGIALMLKGDIELGLGARHGDSPVLNAAMNTLKDEVGCPQLTEQKFQGEFLHRGNVKLMSALDMVHQMELADAMVAAAKIPESATAADATKAIAAHNWSSFSFSGYSYLRYPDGDAKGVHSWGDATREKWGEAFARIYNYEQCIPVWFRGISEHFSKNKSVEEGGWTMPGEQGLWDRMVAY